MSKSPTFEELLIAVNQFQKRVFELEQRYKTLRKFKKHNELLLRKVEQLEENAKLHRALAIQSEKKAELFENENKWLKRENKELKEKLAKYEPPRTTTTVLYLPPKMRTGPVRTRAFLRRQAVSREVREDMKEIPWR